MRIKAVSEELQQKAQETESAIEQLTRTYHECSRILKSITAPWEGEAAELAENARVQWRNAMDAGIRKLSTYPPALTVIAQRYRSAEVSGIQTALELPSSAM